MLNQKSVLARLLANENIIVQHGNYQTAFFDVKSRVLGLPMWKEMSRDVIDMLIGHEVSHALYTPENFNDYNKEGVPHSWYNVVEDVRIEKLILRKYPGLVSNFKRGYHTLMTETNLFGTKEADISSFSFIDRLNLKAKARDLIDVPFSDEEMVYVKKSMLTETYEDVVALVEEIYNWLKEKVENEEANNADANSMADNNESEMSSDSGMGIGNDAESEEESGEGQSAPSDKGEETDEKPEETESDSSNGEGEEDKKEETTNGTPSSDLQSAGGESRSTGQPVEAVSELEEALTDVLFKENAAEELIDNDGFLYAEGITKAMADNMTVDYKRLANSRIAVQHQVTTTYDGMDDWMKRRYNITAGVSAFPQAEYVSFVAETKRVVNLMVREFEMRKSAYRTQRARTSTKGSLDVNKLHKYKYDDMLFKQATQLADAKNHGMMMLIDYSGSMNRVLPSVIRQLLALTMFCKRVGIPFEVYSFTSAAGEMLRDNRIQVRECSPSVTHVNGSECALIQLFSDKMSKRDYEEAFKAMFWQSVNPLLQQGYESLGSTPLDEALMALHHKIADFRKRNVVEKMNLITLTDGASNGIHINYGSDYDRANSNVQYGKYAINIGGKIIKVERSRGYGNNREVTTALIKSIRNMGVNVINYFVAATNSEVKNEIYRSFTGWVDKAVVNTARKDIRNNGVHVLDENSGYNRRFILMGGTAQLDGEIDDIDVSSDMSAAKIAKAFGKASDSKKKSRIVTQKFAEIVA